jgi:hypothetical protein
VADLGHPALEEAEVMDGDEGGAEHFFDVEEVAKVAAGEIFQSLTGSLEAEGQSRGTCITYIERR